MTATAQILDEAVTAAIETMAFMTLFPPDEEATIPADGRLGQVEFRGTASGVLEILASGDFCALLAENIAATEDADEAVRADALKEFCNVTCGLVLPHLAGSASDVFDVTVPVIREGEAGFSWEAFCRLPGVVVFNIEGFAVAVRLSLVKSPA